MKKQVKLTEQQKHAAWVDHCARRWEKPAEEMRRKGWTLSEGDHGHWVRKQ